MHSTTDPVDEGGSGFLGHLYTGVAATIVLVVLCCGVYPALVWGIAQTAFPARADGSLVDRAGKLTTNPDDAVGSELLAQGFAAAEVLPPAAQRRGRRLRRHQQRRHEPRPAQ